MSCDPPDEPRPAALSVARTLMLVGVVVGVADLAVDTYFVIGVMWTNPPFAGLRDGDNSQLAVVVYALAGLRIVAYAAICWLVLWLRHRLAKPHNGGSGMSAAILGALGLANVTSVAVTYSEVMLALMLSLDSKTTGSLPHADVALWASLVGDGTLLVIAVTAVVALLLPPSRRYCAAPGGTAQYR